MNNNNEKVTVIFVLMVSGKIRFKRDLTMNVFILTGKIFGTMFLPEDTTNNNNNKLPVVITITGGVKQGNVHEHFASYLAHHGFATLALAFFGVKGLCFFLLVLFIKGGFRHKPWCMVRDLLPSFKGIVIGISS